MERLINLSLSSKQVSHSMFYAASKTKRKGGKNEVWSGESWLLIWCWSPSFGITRHQGLLLWFCILYQWFWPKTKSAISCKRHCYVCPSKDEMGLLKEEEEDKSFFKRIAIHQSSWTNSKAYQPYNLKTTLINWSSLKTIYPALPWQWDWNRDTLCPMGYLRKLCPNLRDESGEEWKAVLSMVGTPPNWVRRYPPQSKVPSRPKPVRFHLTVHGFSLCKMYVTTQLANLIEEQGLIWYFINKLAESNLWVTMSAWG